VNITKEMELKNLNEATACLLHLVIDNKKLVNENLVNVYTDYPDEPYFCDNLFVMYRETTIKALLNLQYELRKNKYFHSLRQIRINDQWYEIAVFTLPKEIKTRRDILISGGPAELSKSEMSKTLELFNGIHTNLPNVLFTNEFHEVKSVIPFGDVIEDPFEDMSEEC
jgi:hypothetical protein